MSDRLVLAADGPPLTARLARDAIADALMVGAETVVVPIERLDAAFFDLVTGLAGDIVQAFVTYRRRLVIVGDLPPAADASRAFAAFVREANRGTQTRFVGSLDELDAAAAGPKPDVA